MYRPPKNHDYQKLYTPQETAELLVYLADPRVGDAILEPSCGNGNILQAIDQYRQRFLGLPSELTVVGVENSVEALDRAYGRLISKGMTYIPGDFLDMTLTKVVPDWHNRPTRLPLFDKIIANPPFDGAGALAHVTHMWGFLKPGGTLVTIIPAGSFIELGRFMGETHGLKSVGVMPIDNWFKPEKFPIQILKMVKTCTSTSTVS